MNAITPNAASLSQSNVQASSGLPTHIPASKLVEQYIALRDKKDEIKKRHSAELAPYTVAMDKIEGALAQQMLSAGAVNFKTEKGTCFFHTTTSIKVVNWSETLDFIRENDCWELLEARVNKTNAAQMMEDRPPTIAATGGVVPGTEVTREQVVQIRRS